MAVLTPPYSSSGYSYVKIAIGADHGGFELKQQLIPFLHGKGLELLDLGTDSSDSVDYPLFGEAVAEAVSQKRADLGIVICGTGIGISIGANKVPGIRAALVTSPEMASLARQHNNANILALGGRILSLETAKACISAWLNAEYEGGRHQRRLDLIETIEHKSCK